MLSELFSDPGPPLGPDDFFLASQLRTATTNETAEQMMLPPLRSFNERLILEEKELEGAETESRKSRAPKNGLSKLT